MDRNFTYDAENRQVTAELAGVTSSYVYDGNGQRVSKTVSGQTTTYVYDAWGNLAAEYSTQGATSPCGTPTCYLTQDHLGSTRMVTDNVGSSNNVVRYDYLPFGQEVTAGIGGRTLAMGYVALPDAMNPKFTGQMRDTETGLDYFNARYYSPLLGRFQRVDAGNAGADPSDPQTLNGYAYVGNQPLTDMDPSGTYALAGATTGETICGLVCAGIGAVADLGIALWAIFGGGGPSVPSWSGTAWALGPAQTVAGVGIDGSTNSPWSEQPPFGMPGGNSPFGGLSPNSLAPNPGAGTLVLQTVKRGIAGALSDALGLTFWVVLNPGQTQQDEAIWLRTGRLPGVVPPGPTMSGSKGGKQKVSHDWVADKAQRLFPDDDICTALKKLMDRARKAGDSETFNAAKAT